MKITEKFVVKCEVFGLDESFQSSCFGHAFSKACQYAITNKKVYMNLKFVSIKSLVKFAKMHNLA